MSNVLCFCSACFCPRRRTWADTSNATSAERVPAENVQYHGGNTYTKSKNKSIFYNVYHTHCVLYCPYIAVGTYTYIIITLYIFYNLCVVQIVQGRKQYTGSTARNPSHLYNSWQACTIFVQFVICCFFANTGHYFLHKCPPRMYTIRHERTGNNTKNTLTYEHS